MENPYTTPVSESDRQSVVEVSDDVKATLSSAARSVFLGWERLRIVYIAILAPITVLLAGPALLETRMMFLVLEGAIVANVCYFAGPMVETYIRWLGYEGKSIRWCLFVSGTLLTIMLAAASLFGGLLPNQN